MKKISEKLIKLLKKLLKIKSPSEHVWGFTNQGGDQNEITRANS